MALVNLPAAQQLGHMGRGVLVGFQDTGFDNLNHRCFRQLEVVATWDFVNGDPNVGNEGDVGLGYHGTRTLSVMAGLDSGRFIGAAPAAKYVLTKTENSTSETPIEEDYWVAGLWFHDSIGVEVLSSSLSYRDWYDWDDLDGRTAVTTRAADSAAAAGMVIVNSMGNTGEAAYPQTKMGAPADGFGVLSVGGVHSDGSYWERASQGPTRDGRIKPDFAALAVSVYTAANLNDTGYAVHSGTSFSCPAVAGIVALMLEANPALTPDGVREILRRTASRAGAPDTLTGWGLPDALAAVQAAIQSAAPVVPAAPLGWNMSAYPNPFNSGLTVVWNSGTPGRIGILDLAGRLILNISPPPSASQIRFSPPLLPPGIYWIRAEFGGTVRTLRATRLP